MFYNYLFPEKLPGDVWLLEEGRPRGGQPGDGQRARATQRGRLQVRH